MRFFGKKKKQEKKKQRKKTKKKNKYLKSRTTEKSPCVKNAIYSKTSMTRPIVRLPWKIRTRFLSPYEILPVAQENKYLGKFCYFIMKLYVVCTR